MNTRSLVQPTGSARNQTCSDAGTCDQGDSGASGATRSSTDPGASSTLGRFAIPGIGAIAWAAWAAAYRDHLGWWDWPSIALVFSPFVVVPLGLSIVQRPETGPVVPLIHTLRRLVPFAAAFVAASFLVTPGWRAALMTAPWVGLTCALAVIGVMRTMSRRSMEPGMATDAALGFLAIGSIWVTSSRLGANPLGYDDLLVLMTAVHLHYAGFALPIAAGFASIRCRARGVVPAAVVIAIWATGLGVAVGGNPEWIAATLIGVAGLATAQLLIRTEVIARGAGRTLVAIGGISLGAAMVFGIGWAWAIRFGWSYLDVSEMARVHGTLNAFGFAVLGLIGLNLLPEPSIPTRRVVVRFALAPYEVLEQMAKVAAGDDPTTGDGSRVCSSVVSAALPYGFEAGRDAIQRWIGHRSAGIRHWPEKPAIAVGTTLAVSTPVGPAAIAATLRITEVFDEPNRFGFTYAALNDHPETGQQTMMIERSSDGTARAVVTTSCGPWLVLARLLPSVTQRVQERIREQYLAGITGWNPTETHHASNDTVRNK